ncbi:MFS transporter [Oxalobacter vibrioformis]|uniref:MFS transporter n=2 Tax=Oxalobacter vibrioformis TaxID=933080 RepID=A0A9E9M243_9BURK|nr:MFS transporter [Oxalobacter vibrioformis]
MQRYGRWVVLGIVSSALMLVVMDMTVLYTALPSLTHDLKASASQKLWIMNAYPLVVAGLLPGLGTLGDHLGHKRMFVGGLMVFGVASLFAAFSPVPESLIAARVLLAVGAAMMMPATLSIIRVTFTDEKERAMAFGIWGAVASGGAAFGPVVGGVLLEYFWWGSVFLINVPVVIAALVTGVLLLPEGKKQKGRTWDLVGSVQVMVGLVGLAYAVKEIARRDSSWVIALAAAITGVIGMVVFVRRQTRSRVPLIDFSLFRNRPFSMGVIVALVMSVAMVGVELVFSQRLQLVLQLSPLKAALLLIPLPLAAFVTGPLSGWLVARFGMERVVWMALMAACAGLLGLLLFKDASRVYQGISLVFLGMGTGAGMTAASNAIMSNAPAERSGMAASVEEVSYELGGAIGIALMGSLLSIMYTVSFVVPESANLPAVVRDSLDEALLVAEGLGPQAAAELFRLASAAFEKAYAVVLSTAFVIVLATALAFRLSGHGDASSSFDMRERVH